MKKIFKGILTFCAMWLVSVVIAVLISDAIDKAYNKRNEANETEIERLRSDVDSLKNKIQSLENYYTSP
jgi:peptidoglycan hydrolase CwlO-like protein